MQNLQIPQRNYYYYFAHSCIFILKVQMEKNAILTLVEQ